MRPLKSLLALLLASALALLALPAAAQGQGPCGDSVTVVAGDTLNAIAARCGTSVEMIVAANPEIINPNFVYVGQQLTMPSASDGSEPDTPGRYIVQPGDTLTSIARRFGTTVAAIVAANPQISNPDFIYVGQPVTIPGQAGNEGRTVTIAPTSGPPGTPVQVAASGFPANIAVNLGVGRWRSEYDIVGNARTSDDGSLNAQVTIPDVAGTNERWVVTVVATDDPTLKTSSNSFDVIPATGEAPTFDEVQLFLIAEGGGDIGCGDRAVPVTEKIAPTRAPLTAAIEALLAVDAQHYGQSGLYNALARSDLTVESIAVRDGTATIRLTGDYRVGGVCDDPRVTAQFEQTATQFDTVRRAEIFINGTPLADLTSGR